VTTITTADDPDTGFRQYRFVPPEGATTVLLVRHGESAPAHPERPFPLRDGHGDPPLDPVGERQAELLADRLQHERIDAIYVTTLQRTHQTAAPLAHRLGVSPIEEPDLREVFLGDWEGGQFRVRAAAGDPLFRQIWTEERWDVIPGAEVHDAFDERVWRGFQRIVSAHRNGTVMVVSHGGVIGQLLHRVTGSSRFAFSGADNASISEIVAAPERLVLRRYNDTAHLLPLVSSE
jgi:probable phosphoglycerate mutase